ncbi:MAG: hypothetical protein WBG19_03535 [Thermoplasmata archaeon]
MPTSPYLEPPAEPSAPTTSSRTLLDRYLAPLGVVAILFVGATLLLEAARGGTGAPLGIGAGVVGAGGVLAVAILLSGSGERAARPRHFHPTVPSNVPISAFVCTKCSEYAPAPDWRALLTDAGPSDPIDPRRYTERAIAALASSTPLPWAPRFPVETGSLLQGEFVSAPETAFVPPASVRAPAEPEGYSDLLLFSGRLIPVPADSPGVGISGAHRAPISRSPPPRPATPPGLESSVRVVAEAAALGPPPVGSDRRAGPSAYAGLDAWIRGEVEGIVARATAQTRASGPTEPSAGTAACAACRQAVGEADLALVCPDCLRPICDPCRDRVVEHDGATWCGPCAVIRLSTEFLGAVEEPTDESARPLLLSGVPN